MTVVAEPSRPDGCTGPPGPGEQRSSSSELRAAARGGLVTLVGSTLGAVLGFALIVVLARLLGVSASGEVLQMVAVFTIALALTRLGLDTTAVWLLPRLLDEDARTVPAALSVLLLPALAVPTTVVAAWFGLRAIVPGPVLGAGVDEAVSAAAWFLPAASVMTVALAATRAFGGVVPFNAIGSVGAPAARLAGVALAAAAGGTAALASAGWGVSWLLGMVAALVVLRRQVRRVVPRGTASARPSAALTRRVASFSLPRTVSAALEQANTWIAVVLVGMIAGSAQAGAYGSAARFVAAGVIVATAVRIVVAPRFSALLGRGETGAVQELYGVTARWVLLFGAPVYVVLAVNAGTVLGWLGDGFAEARGSMVILCLGSIVMLAAGNVQSLLLMSGGSGRAALNKGIALAVLVVATLVLVPRMGMAGAAVAWVTSTMLDTVLAARQVRRTTGIALEPVQIVAVLGVVAGCVALPCWLALGLLGPGVPGLLTGTAAAAALLLVACRLGRGPLHVTELTAMFGRRRSTGAGATS